MLHSGGDLAPVRFFTKQTLSSSSLSTHTFVLPFDFFPSGVNEPFLNLLGYRDVCWAAADLPLGLQELLAPGKRAVFSCVGARESDGNCEAPWNVSGEDRGDGC